jgi:hypothetical protein
MFFRDPCSYLRPQGKKLLAGYAFGAANDFPSLFILLTVGLWLVSPVVCVVDAGGLALEVDVWSGSVFAGRAAVAGGGLVCETSI